MVSDNSRKRAIFSYKQYLVLKTIAEMGGRDIYYSQVVARLHDKITWAHASNILSWFDKVGIINTKKVGRLRIIELTPKGKHVLQIVEELIKLTKPIDEK